MTKVELNEKIFSFFPFFEQIKNYSKKKFRQDLIAGLTVAIIALPQSMAYAIIAGVHPKYGLYAAIIPVIVCSLFSSSRFLIAGPTNAISMVISSSMAGALVGGLAISALPEEYRISLLFLLSFLVGAVQLAMGLGRMGGLLNFISHSVVVGFTAGAGVLIAANQLKNFFGLKIPSHPEFVNTLVDTIRHLPEANWTAAGLGAFTILFIIIMKKISTKIPGPLLAMVLAGALTAFLGLESSGVKLIGEIPRSLPPFSLPAFNLDAIRGLFMPAVAIALLGLIEALSIGKSIASLANDRINGNQELISQGTSNIAAAFFSGIPGSGSFTRSAVNYSANAASHFAGVISGLFVALILVVFAPIAKFIPIASLAGILIVIAFSMINKKAIYFSYKATFSDRVVLIVTFLATLFLDLEKAVYAGVILSIVLFLRKISNPQVQKVVPRAEDHKMIPYIPGRSCPQVLVFDVFGALFFGAIEELERNLRELSVGEHDIMIIRMKGVRILDATGAHALEGFLKAAKARGVKSIFTNVRPSVRRTIVNSGLIHELGEENIAEDTTAAVALAVQVFADKDICAACKNRVFKECPK